MRDIKILVCGHAQHGKDTFASLLAEELNLKYSPVTQIFIKDHFEEINNAIGGVYTSAKWLYKYRSLHRDVLFDMISIYNKEDAGRFVKEVLSVADFYVGLRAKREYEATKHLFDYKFWAYNRHKPVESSRSNELVSDEEFVMVDNSGDLLELKGKASLAAHYIKKTEESLNESKNRTRVARP